MLYLLVLLLFRHLLEIVEMCQHLPGDHCLCFHKLLVDDLCANPCQLALGLMVRLETRFL